MRTARAVMHCCALLLLLCLSPVASLQLGGVLGRNGLLRTTPGPALLRSCTPPRMQQRWGPVDVTLSKPLGLVLEEFGSGGTSGVVVVSLVEGGAAEESGDVLPGDRLSRVDGADVSKLDFDTVMEVLAAAPETLVSDSPEPGGARQWVRGLRRRRHTWRSSSCDRRGGL